MHSEKGEQVGSYRYNTRPEDGGKGEQRDGASRPGVMGRSSHDDDGRCI